VVTNYTGPATLTGIGTSYAGFAYNFNQTTFTMKQNITMPSISFSGSTAYAAAFIGIVNTSSAVNVQDWLLTNTATLTGTAVTSAAGVIFTCGFSATSTIQNMTFVSTCTVTSSTYYAGLIGTCTNSVNMNMYNMTLNTIITGAVSHFSGLIYSLAISSIVNVTNITSNCSLVGAATDVSGIAY